MVTISGCKGTIEYFASLHKDKPGISRIATIAVGLRIIFTYDHALIIPQFIFNIVETLIRLDDSAIVKAFRCVSIE